MNFMYSKRQLEQLLNKSPNQMLCEQMDLPNISNVSGSSQQSDFVENDTILMNNNLYSDPQPVRILKNLFTINNPKDPAGQDQKKQIPQAWSREENQIAVYQKANANKILEEAVFGDITNFNDEDLEITNELPSETRKSIK